MAAAKTVSRSSCVRFSPSAITSHSPSTDKIWRLLRLCPFSYCKAKSSNLFFFSIVRPPVLQITKKSRLHKQSGFFGGDTQIRTGESGFCRPMPYHLAMSPYWSGRRGSNSLPPPWQGGALPDELNPHLVVSTILYARYRNLIRKECIGDRNGARTHDL